MLLSCATFKQKLVKLPDFTAAWQIKIGNQTPEAKKVSQAMIIFYNQWIKHFGDRDGKVLNALNNLMIEWSVNKKTVSGYDINGQYVNNASVVGASLTPGYVWLYARDDKKIHSSSLIHELVHISIWAKHRWSHGDADHEGDKYKGWTKKHTLFIHEINNMLKKFDL